MTRPARPRSAAAAARANSPIRRRRVVHQRAGLRRLRRLRRAVQLRGDPAGRDRVRPQAPHRPVELQQGFLLPQGLLPQLRDGGRRRTGQGQRPARAGSRDAALPACCPSRNCPRSTGPGACWSPASAAPAWSPSAHLLGMAAHMEGKGAALIDMVGISQKNGAVVTHLKIGARPEDICRRARGARPGRSHPRLRSRHQRLRAHPRRRLAQPQPCRGQQPRGDAGAFHP